MPAEIYHYLIIRVEDDNCKLLYWNMDAQKWTEDLTRATRFDRPVLCESIPRDAAGIMECDANGIVLHFYGVIDLPVVGLGTNVRFYEQVTD